MKTLKRGQVTVFVILAIILVAAVLVVVYTQRNFVLSTFDYVPSSIQPINNEVLTCLKTVTEDGIYLIGMQGGHINVPSVFFETNFSYIGYGYANRQRFLPTISQIENSLSDYVNTMLPICVDFSKFPEFEIYSGNIASKAVIKDNFVAVDVNWPVSVKKDSTYRLDKFNTRVDVRLGKIYNITDTIVSSEMSSPDKIDLAYLISINDEENITADTLFFNDTVVYTLIDSNSQINNNDYMFLFANKFL